MNSRPSVSFQRPLFRPQALQKSNLEAMMESLLLAQQKQDKYVKHLPSKVDVLTTHNKMLKAKIIQQASFPPTRLDRLLSKPESNPREHGNCVTVKDGV